MKYVLTILNYELTPIYITEIYDNGKECRFKKDIKNALIFNDYQTALNTMNKLNLSKLKLVNIYNALILENKFKNQDKEIKKYFDNLNALGNN